MARECVLVLLARSMVDDGKRVYEYYAGHAAPVPWVALKSNAMLFDKSEARRAFLNNEEFAKNNKWVEGELTFLTEFELIDLMEGKSFGWAIKDSAQWLHRIESNEGLGEATYFWANSQHNAILFSEDFKRVVMEKLRERYPATKFEAVELFTR